MKSMCGNTFKTIIFLIEALLFAMTSSYNTKVIEVRMTSYLVCVHFTTEEKVHWR